jgi:hypothetical protein
MMIRTKSCNNLDDSHMVAFLQPPVPKVQMISLSASVAEKGRADAADDMIGRSLMAAGF